MALASSTSRSTKFVVWTLLILVAAWVLWWLWPTNLSAPKIPRLFTRDVPDHCRQALLVLTKSAPDHTGTMWMLERPKASAAWHRHGSPIPVTIGRNGLAWGAGEHRAAAPTGFRIKAEGDGCSPAGIFRLPYAFGYAATALQVKLPYLPVTPNLMGVDDVKSKFYNQVVDVTTVQRDWDSHETMLRPDGLYRWGALIDHNPTHVPSGGSCIFLHLWSGPEGSTAGCTAMAEEHLLRVLAWLDPSLEPRIIQGLTEW